MNAAPAILILNGPNLNMLGTRQPEIYGAITLDAVELACQDAADGLGLAIDFRQSNHEGELVEWVQQAKNNFAAIIINAGAYSHTSIALLDALLCCAVPVIEVHLSNIHRREAFRNHSYVSQAALGVICGLGVQGYVAAVAALAEKLLGKVADETNE